MLYFVTLHSLFNDPTILLGAAVREPSSLADEVSSINLACGDAIQFYLSLDGYLIPSI